MSRQDVLVLRDGRLAVVPAGARIDYVNCHAHVRSLSGEPSTLWLRDGRHAVIAVPCAIRYVRLFDIVERATPLVESVARLRSVARTLESFAEPAGVER